MSRMESRSNLTMPLGVNMGRNDSSVDQMDDNYDEFNDETFGEMASTDWESEHEKLATSLTGRRTDPNDNKLKDNSSKINYNKNTSLNESRDEEELEDLIAKSLADMGLVDEEFEDPAIMTYARSSKPLNISSTMDDMNRRLSRSSPPPPAFLAYEEYSASPKTQSIWSTTQVDSDMSQTINSANMRTLEDIENDMINKNTNQLRRMSAISKPISVEDLEANFMNETPDRREQNRDIHSEETWSPFGIQTMNNFIPNGRITSDVGPNVETVDNSMRTEKVSSNDSIVNTADDNINLKAVQMMASELIKEPIDPLLKAQTLSEIERQLISNQSSPQRVNMVPNIAQSRSPIDVPNSVHNPPVLGHPVVSVRPYAPNSVNRPIPPHFAMRFAQNMAQNRFNNLFSRQPVRQLMPGMVPAIGRTMFSPALIPNSQRIFPYGMQTRPLIHPLLHPLHIQQQQQHHIQQQYLQQRHQQLVQSSRQLSNRFYDDNINEDEYAGLMTQREKEWLIKIQQFQTELKDPYVDDYYYVTYISRKIAAKAAIDKENKTTPSLLLPVRPKPAPEPDTPKYIPIQFEGSLGKIQVSNVNCPRKLLDCKLNKANISPNETTGDTKPITKSEVQKFRKLLLQIEKLYVALIDIDDEDKRMGALPEEARLPHLETRKQLCDRLFKGLTNETQDKLNLEVIQIKKGLALLFRSLSYLSDESQRGLIISDLLNANNFRQYVIKPKDRLDYGLMLVNAIQHIHNHEVLLRIVQNINNISFIIKSEYGQPIIESIINQWQKLDIKEENKSKWSKFVNNVLVQSDELPEIKQLCRNHLTDSGL